MIKMKTSFRLPAVLSICLLLMFIATAGSFFSASLSLLSYAGLILAVSFSALPLIANQNINIQEPEGFAHSQFYSIIINSIMLLAMATYIIYKSVIVFSNPHSINPSITCITAFSAFAGLILCLKIIYPQIKKSKALKILFIKYVFCALLAPFIFATSFIHYFKGMYFLDPAVSIFIAVLIVVQVVLLMKQSVFELI